MAKRRERERGTRAHAWRMMVAFRLDDWQAHAMGTSEDRGRVGEVPPGGTPPPDDERVWLRAEMVDQQHSGGPICFVCEQPWTLKTADEPCPGDPAGGAE